jgi:hypothetical protein
VRALGLLLLPVLLAQAPPRHLEDPARCVDCHAPQAGRHAASAHARAFTSSSFQRSWRRGGGDPWCLSCHVSQADRPEAGVSCAGCHQPARASAETCADCHEFAFPRPRASFADPIVPLGVLMQATLTEHRASGAPSCARCHMPEGDHGFPGVALAAEALKVEVSPAGVFTLTARRVGHAVPTGDPFRRVRVSRCEDRACAVVVDASELGREWKKVGDDVVELSDTRPRPGAPARVALEGPGRFYKVELILTERGLPEEAVLIDEGEIP